MAFSGNRAVFPSYKVITGSYNRGGYFADNLRNITESGIRHIMRLLLKYATGQEEGAVHVAPKAHVEVEDKTFEMARNEMRSPSTGVKADTRPAWPAVLLALHIFQSSGYTYAASAFDPTEKVLTFAR